MTHVGKLRNAGPDKGPQLVHLEGGRRPPRRRFDIYHLLAAFCAGFMLAVVALAAAILGG